MKRASVLLSAALVVFPGSAALAAGTLHIVIMAPADPKLEGPKYEALSAYLTASNPLLGDVKLRIAKDYPEAARLFRDGDVEGMFSGSFVAAIFIAKGVAKPVARPLGAGGVSTYGAAIVAREGTKPFAGLADFAGKRVAYTPLASAGEIFLRALVGPGAALASRLTPVPVVSHQAALEAVQGGAADYAVVKSTLFAAGSFAGLAQVGTDDEAYPDNTFIMPNDPYERLGPLISRVLLGLEADASEKALAVKQAFGCTGFIPTAGSDFLHTFTLIKKAGIDPRSFDFAF